MGPDPRRKWSLTGRIAFAVLAAFVLVLQGLSAAKRGGSPDGLQLVLIGLVAFVALIDNVRTAWNRFRAPDRDRQRASVQKAIVAAFVEVSRLAAADGNSQVRIEDIGASVFVVSRCTRWDRRHWLPLPHREDQLIRRERFRLSHHPPPSSVIWKRGKGVVGRCWELSTPVYLNKSAIAQRYRGGTLTPEKFAKIPEKTVAGFTFEEFAEIVGKYSEVLAVPIKTEDGLKLLGVLSLDYPLKAATARTILDGQLVEGCASAAAAVMRDDIPER